jgi:hypothetical protein
MTNPLAPLCFVLMLFGSKTNAAVAPQTML